MSNLSNVNSPNYSPLSSPAEQFQTVRADYFAINNPYPLWGEKLIFMNDNKKQKHMNTCIQL